MAKHKPIEVEEVEEIEDDEIAPIVNSAASTFACAVGVGAALLILAKITGVLDLLYAIFGVQVP